MMLQAVILLYLFNLPCAFGALGGLVGRLQSAGVEGTLTCDGKPAGGVLIKLYDDDRGLDTDDLMAEGRTDRNGAFRISGSLREGTTIDPKLNIYHDCHDEWMPCQRKISIMIPDSYVTNGETPKNFYKAGTIELAGKIKGETRDCIH